jgi:hypothetical protein
MLRVYVGEKATRLSCYVYVIVHNGLFDLTLEPTGRQTGPLRRGQKSVPGTRRIGTVPLPRRGRGRCYPRTNVRLVVSTFQTALA